MDLVIGDTRGTLVGVGDLQLLMPRGFRVPAHDLQHRFGRTFITMLSLRTAIKSDNQPQGTGPRGQELLDAIPALTAPYITSDTPRRKSA